MGLPVNVDGIEEPFATVIRRALAKDPAERYDDAVEDVAVRPFFECLGAVELFISRLSSAVNMTGETRAGRGPSWW